MVLLPHKVIKISGPLQLMDLPFLLGGFHFQSHKMTDEIWPIHLFSKLKGPVGDGKMERLRSKDETPEFRLTSRNTLRSPTQTRLFKSH